MGKGNYYFNANVGYILLEEFDEKFVSVLCIANNKKYSFLDKDILNDFEEKLFVSKNMVDFYTKEHKHDDDSLDLYFSKFSRIIEENVNKKEVTLTEKVTLAGRYCESGDILIKNIQI